MRYDAPVPHSTFRYAAEDLEIGGVTIPAGGQVIISLAAANRDASGSRDAERFDIQRRENRHLAFGHGIHFCLGAPLARARGRGRARRAAAALPRPAPRDRRRRAALGPRRRIGPPRPDRAAGGARSGSSAVDVSGCSGSSRPRARRPRWPRPHRRPPARARRTRPDRISTASGAHGPRPAATSGLAHADAHAHEVVGLEVLHDRLEPVVTGEAAAHLHAQAARRAGRARRARSRSGVGLRRRGGGRACRPTPPTGSCRSAGTRARSRLSPQSTSATSAFSFDRFSEEPARSARSATTSAPRLCRLRLYSSPGLPNPTTSKSAAIGRAAQNRRGGTGWVSFRRWSRTRSAAGAPPSAPASPSRPLRPRPAPLPRSWRAWPRQ